MFNSGDLTSFLGRRSLLDQHANLRDRSEFLLQKIRLMAVIDLFFSRDADDRRVSFAEVARHTQLLDDQVEMLIMKAMSLNLIKGVCLDGQRHGMHCDVQVQCFESVQSTYAIDPFSRRLTRLTDACR